MVKKEKKETFEQALARLEGIVARLEEGEMPLEEALKNYETGVKAYTHCNALLEEVKKRIEMLTKDTKGVLASKDAEGLDPAR